MADAGGRNPMLALGELRGLLAAFAWANTKCDHSCTFSVEELPAGAGLQESLAEYFGDSAKTVSATEIDDWYAAVGDTLLRWLFLFRDLVKPTAACALTDQRCQGEMVAIILDAFIAGLQPLAVWRVEMEPRGFYECAWDDFAIRGASGLFLLHLGVSD
jgi:hypothetical protein